MHVRIFRRCTVKSFLWLCTSQWSYNLTATLPTELKVQNSRRRCGAEYKNGDPWENRTPDFAVRGRRLSRLTKGPYFGKKLVFPQIRKRAGTYLFSQVVSNQVSSAQPSLTSVFGMGTGGTLASSAPAMNVLEAIA